MKKNLLFLFALICSMSLFTACSDDDDARSIQTEFDGVYKGTLDVKAVSLGINEKDIPQKVYIVKTGENLFKLELKKFVFQGIPIGDIVLDNIAVIKDGNNCTFSGSGEVTLTVGKCNVTTDGSIQGENTIINIVVNVGALKVDVAFEGKKMEADQSSEASMLTFAFDSKLVAVAPEAISDNMTFRFFEDVTDAQLKTLIPTLTISDKSTVTPAIGASVDFTNPVKYTVTSEDGITKKEYTITVIRREITKYDFEDWQTVEVKDDWTDELLWSYVLPLNGGWAGADAALSLVRAMLANENIDFTDRSIKAISDAHAGSKAAEIKTLDTHGQASIMPGIFPAIPKVTSGSLFLGAFEVDAMNTLRSTRFGIQYNKKPISVKGYYKYAPGTTYYRCDNVAESNVAVVDGTKKDECSISAVIYEVKSYDTPVDPSDPSDERLNGTNIYSSPSIIASAQLTSGKKDAYTPFDLQLTYRGVFDPAKLYRFAIICSSSKDGDKFCGAPGSTLIIDDVEVVTD